MYFIILYVYDKSRPNGTRDARQGHLVEACPHAQGLKLHLVEACPHAQGLKLRLSGLSPIQQVRGQAAKFLDDLVRGHLRVQEVLDVRLAGARRRPWLP